MSNDWYRPNFEKKYILNYASLAYDLDYNSSFVDSNEMSFEALES